MFRLGEKVAERRKTIGISQAELARRVEVHQTMISAIERGEKLPAFDLLVRLQDALGEPLVPPPPAAAGQIAPEQTVVESTNA